MKAATPESIRRSVFTRTPLSRTVWTPAPAWRLPRWARRLLLLLLALPFLLLALVACNEWEKPVSLADSTLVGPRLTTGPICVEEAVDVSGSMNAYTAQRERAERELFAFARRELGPDDRLSEAFFAGSARTVLAPSALATLGASPAVPDGIEYTTTLLAPAVEALVAARADRPGICSARALVVITDGEVVDEAAELRRTLRAANYTRMYAVIPAAAGWGRPPQLTGDVLDAVAVYHFHEGGVMGRAASVFGDAKPLDVVLGEIVGALTGQRLGRAEKAQAYDGTGRSAYRRRGST